MGSAKRIGRDLRVVPASELFRERPEVPAWYSRWPDLYKYITHLAAKHPGKPLPSLTVFCQAGRMRVCFCDRIHWRSIFRTADTLEEALARLNEALASGNVDWKKSVRKRSIEGRDVTD